MPLFLCNDDALAKRMQSQLEAALLGHGSGGTNPTGEDDDKEEHEDEHDDVEDDIDEVHTLIVYSSHSFVSCKLLHGLTFFTGKYQN